MYFLIGLFIFTVAVIGMNFCFLLIGGTPFHKGEEFAPVKLGKKTYTVERFAVAVSTSVFGASWLVAWFYFFSPDGTHLYPNSTRSSFMLFYN